jgi:hypothetical protein
VGWKTKLIKELPGLAEITNMFMDKTEMEDPTGTISKNEFVPGRSSVFTIAVLHLLLERAAAFDEQSTDAWTAIWEMFMANRVLPTNNVKLNGRGGIMINVDACTMKPKTTALMVSGACEATFSSQGNEKFRVALDMKTAGRNRLLNETNKFMFSRDIGKLETTIWTCLSPAKHPLTNGLFRVIAGKISKVRDSFVIFEVLERIETDREPTCNGVIKRSSNKVVKLPIFDALTIEKAESLTVYEASLGSCEKLYDVTVTILPPEEKTKEGTTIGAGATILGILTGKVTFLALTDMVNPSVESTSNASLTLPPTTTEIRQEMNVQLPWILGNAFGPESEPIRAVTESVESKKFENVKNISLPVMTPLFWMVMKETEDGGSDCKEGEEAGTICIQFSLGAAPHSIIREFNTKLQASRLASSRIRIVNSATVAELGRVLKKSLG